jgi:hypothetical protein
MLFINDCRYRKYSKRQLLKELYFKSQEAPDPPVDMNVFNFSFDVTIQEEALLWCGVEKIDALLAAIEAESPPDLSPKRGPRPLLGSKDILIYTLVWFWTGLTPKKLSSGCAYSERGLRQAMENFINHRLVHFASAMVSYPSVIQWIMQRGNMELDNPLDLRFNADGTPLETWSFTDPEIAREGFNMKHQMAAVSLWIMCSPNGRIVRTSNIETGNKHDASAWDESGVVEELESCYPTPLYVAPNKIVRSMNSRKTVTVKRNAYRPGLNLDKAYPNINIPDGWEIFLTKTAAPDLVPDPRRHLDPTVAKWRSVVERVIHQIKKWKLLDNIAFVSQCDIAYLGTIVKCIAALVNWRCFTELGLLAI